MFGYIGLSLPPIVWGGPEMGGLGQGWGVALNIWGGYSMEWVGVLSKLGLESRWDSKKGVVKFVKG